MKRERHGKKEIRAVKKEMLAGNLASSKTGWF